MPNNAVAEVLHVFLVHYTHPRTLPVVVDVASALDVVSTVSEVAAVHLVGEIASTVSVLGWSLRLLWWVRHLVFLVLLLLVIVRTGYLILIARSIML